MADENKADTVASVAKAALAAVVARGRSVRHEGKLHLPGDEVRGLPKAEVLRLRGTGHLVDPDADPVTEANGPSFERR